MPDDFSAAFAALKGAMAKQAKRLTVQTDTPTEYTLVTKTPSPFPQHKGHPMFFASVKTGKAYVSLHLLPVYMCPELAARISPALKKRMQGKACFNFKDDPGPELIGDLERLTAESSENWRRKNWL